MNEVSETYCSECLYYDTKSEEGVNGEKMAMCEYDKSLVRKLDIACDRFAM